MPISKDKLRLSKLTEISLMLTAILIATSCGASNPLSSGKKMSISVSPEAVILEAEQSQQFTAVFKNVSDKNIAWEIAGCTLDDCGIIEADGLYRAPSVVPSRTTIRITATSQTGSNLSDTVQVTLLPLSVTISEDSVEMCANETHKFEVSILRHPDKAVSWSVSGCSETDCGTIDASGQYRSPATVSKRSTVLITATSQADPTKSDTASVYNMPIAVSVTPPTAIISPGQSQDFLASVKYDINEGGVIWALVPECSPDICGVLSDPSQDSVTYTAPDVETAVSTVKLVAISVSDNDKTAEVDITISDSLTLLKEGDYAFYFNGDYGYQDAYPVWVTAAGRFHVDGRGNITDGLQDFNLPIGVSQSVAFTGSYSVNSDYRGSFDFTTSEETSRYLMTVDSSGTGGKFISFTPPSPSLSIAVSGYFELQDDSAFSLSTVAGPYAMGISSGGREMAAVGRMDVDGTGNISGGRLDITEINTNDWSWASSTQGLSLTGVIREPSPSTGRGTARMSLTPTPPGGADVFNFSYYVVSDQKILLVQTDDRTQYATVLSGEMRRQEGSYSFSSFNAPTIFSLSGISIFISGATIGRIDPDGEGALVGVIDLFDELESSFPPIRNNEFLGSYSIESDGRSEIALEMNLDFDDYNRGQNPDAFFQRNSNQTYVAYFFGQNRGFLMQTSGNRGSYPSFGGFKPQEVGAFTTESIANTFLANTMPGLSLPCTEKSTGLITFDIAGNVTSSVDVNRCSETSHLEFGSQYSVATNGRGTIRFDGPVDREAIFWIISPNDIVAISPTTSGWYWEPALIEFRR